MRMKVLQSVNWGEQNQDFGKSLRALLSPLCQGKGSSLKWPGMVAGLGSLRVSSCTQHVLEVLSRAQHSHCLALPCRPQLSRPWWGPSTPACVRFSRHRLTSVKWITCHLWGRTWWVLLIHAEMSLGALGCSQTSLVIVPRSKMILLKLLRWGKNSVLSLQWSTSVSWDQMWQTSLHKPAWNAIVLWTCVQLNTNYGQY